MAMRDLFPVLSIGPLPNRKELNDLHKNGVRTLLNVSGSRAGDLYGDLLLRQFEIYEYFFRDLFTATPVQGTGAELFSEQELVEMDSAMECLADLLVRHVPVHCFCHQGKSRSATVAAGAMIKGFGVDSAVAVDIVRAKKPDTVFTNLSLNHLSGLRVSRGVCLE